MPVMSGIRRIVQYADGRPSTATLLRATAPIRCRLSASGAPSL